MLSYGSDRRALAWRRKTADEAEALLGALGLTGAFWNLRADDLMVRVSAPNQKRREIFSRGVFILLA